MTDLNKLLSAELETIDADIDRLTRRRDAVLLIISNDELSGGPFNFDDTEEQQKLPVPYARKKRTRPSEQDIAEIRRAARNGSSAYEIAGMFDISLSTAYNVVKKRGVYA